MALKASPEDQARLLDVQAIDTRISQLDHQTKKLPQLQALTGLTAEGNRLRLQRLSESGAVDDTRLELSRIEADVALVETRIKRDADRLQASSSMKDVAGLESELTGLRRRRDELEEIELAVMENLETLENAVRVTEAEQADVLEQVTVLERERDAALATIGAERDAAAANREMIVAGLPADLMALYERQRARYGSGASFLRGGVSGASGVKLLENELASIRSAQPDDVILCPDSHAILVRTSESGL